MKKVNMGFVLWHKSHFQINKTQYCNNNVHTLANRKKM